MTISVSKAWTAIRSNPVFVTLSSAASGAAVNFLYDEIQNGKLDFSAAGFHKLAVFVTGAVVTALYHLYTPKPPAA